MSSDFYGNMQTHSASVFEVHHGVEGPLAEKNWDDAMQPWLDDGAQGFDTAQVNALLAQQAKPCSSRRPRENSG